MDEEQPAAPVKKKEGHDMIKMRPQTGDKDTIGLRHSVSYSGPPPRSVSSRRKSMTPTKHDSPRHRDEAKSDTSGHNASPRKTKSPRSPRKIAVSPVRSPSMKDKNKDIGKETDGETEKERERAKTPKSPKDGISRSQKDKEKEKAREHKELKDRVSRSPSTKDIDKDKGKENASEHKDGVSRTLLTKDKEKDHDEIGHKHGVLRSPSTKDKEKDKDHKDHKRLSLSPRNDEKDKSKEHKRRSLSPSKKDNEKLKESQKEKREVEKDKEPSILISPIEGKITRRGEKKDNASKNSNHNPRDLFAPKQNSKNFLGIKNGDSANLREPYRNIKRSASDISVSGHSGAFLHARLAIIGERDVWFSMLAQWQGIPLNPKDSPKTFLRTLKVDGKEYLVTAYDYTEKKERRLGANSFIFIFDSDRRESFAMLRPYFEEIRDKFGGARFPSVLWNTKRIMDIYAEDLEESMDPADGADPDSISQFSRDLGICLIPLVSSNVQEQLDVAFSAAIRQGLEYQKIQQIKEGKERSSSPRGAWNKKH